MTDQEDESVFAFAILPVMHDGELAYHAHVAMNIPDMEAAMQSVVGIYAALCGLMEHIGAGAAKESATDANARVEQLARMMADGSTKALGVFYQGLAEQREALANEN